MKDISSGLMGVRSSILITYEPGNSELVTRGVNDGMGEVSAVDPSCIVVSFTGVSVFGNDRGKVCPYFIKSSNDANNSCSFFPGMDIPVIISSLDNVFASFSTSIALSSTSYVAWALLILSPVKLG
jgi:hypothetical protein